MIILVALNTIINLILIVSIIKICKKDTIKETKQEKEEPDYDYLYSLKFNTELDGLIQPLLGKYSNSDILDKIVNSLYEFNIKIKSFPKNEIEGYVQDTIKNYSNKYEELEEIKINEEYIDTFETFIHENQSNITNTLNNFYKD